MAKRKKVAESIKPEVKNIPKPEQSLKLPEAPIQPTDIEAIELFSIEEAASYMDVKSETIRLWIDHGHLTTQLINGIKKITFDSMSECQIRGKFFHTLPNKEFLRPDEVAYYFSLSVKTIYGWIDSGKIEAVNVGPGNTVRISREEVEKMVKMKED